MPATWVTLFWFVAVRAPALLRAVTPWFARMSRWFLQLPSPAAHPKFNAVQDRVLPPLLPVPAFAYSWEHCVLYVYGAFLLRAP